MFRRLIPLLIVVAAGAGCDDSTQTASLELEPDASTADTSMAEGRLDQGAPDTGPADASITQDALPADAFVTLDSETVDAFVSLDSGPVEPDALPPVEVDCDEISPVPGPPNRGPAPGGCATGERLYVTGCRVDPRLFDPSMFVVTTIAVSEPEIAAPALAAVLNGAIDSNRLVLLLEPAGYVEADTYRFFFGNGRPWADDIIGWSQRLPIAHWIGQWSDETYGQWQMSRRNRLTLQLPSSGANGGLCFVPLVLDVLATVQMELPITTESGMTVDLQGVLSRPDAEQVELSVGGLNVNLAGFLDSAGQPLQLDTTGDGEPDAYRFDFTATLARHSLPTWPQRGDFNRSPCAYNLPSCD